MFQRANVQRGMAVLSYDGVQVGRVIDTEPGVIIIEKGVFFPRDFRVPLSEISNVQGEELVLVRDRAALQLWYMESVEGTVGVAGHAAPPLRGGLGLTPADLAQARMESAKFQDHGRYDVRPGSHGGLGLGPTDFIQARMDSAKFQNHRRYDVGPSPDPEETDATEEDVSHPSRPMPASEPPRAERRAAGPDGESDPGSKPPTRY